MWNGGCMGKVQRHRVPSDSAALAACWVTVKDNFIYPLHFLRFLLSHHSLHALNKPFESLSNCLCLHQSTPSCFLPPCYLCSLTPNRFPSVYLSFPSVTRDINIFFLLGLIGFWLRWYNIRPSSLWRWSLGLEYWVYFLNMCFGSVFALVALPAVFPILSLRKVLTMNSSLRFNEEDILY